MADETADVTPEMMSAMDSHDAPDVAEVEEVTYE